MLGELTDHERVHEAVALFTCNRTELYLVTDDALEAENATLAILSRQAGLRPTELSGSLYSLRGREAVEHLFSVTAGLDSMIVGEAEIQGQVKRAYEMALVEGVSGPVSNRLFRDALAAGKRVRTETGIARSNVSISTVAVQLAVRLPRRAGRPARARDRRRRERRADGARAARPRRADAVRRQPPLRPRARAGAALRRPGRHASRTCRASSRRPTSSSPRPARRTRSSGARSSSSCRGPRMGRPLVMIDLAVPRDIEPSVRDCPGIALYDMDDLQRAVARNLDAREAEAEEALVLVREEVERFEQLDREPGRGADDLGAARAAPTRSCAQVLDENEPRWESLSEADRERVEVMARAVVSRLLHEPTVRLKDRGSYHYLHTLRELFGLDPAAPAEARPRRRSPAWTSAAARRDPAWHARQRAGAGAGDAGSPSDSDDEVELVTITTSGRPRRRTTDKSRFVKEIEEALLAGEIDLAVHSAKDVPGELPDGLVDRGRARAGRPPRRALRRRLARRAGAGRGGRARRSLRRRAQLLALRADLDVRELRGNVDTRLRRLAAGRLRRDRARARRPGAPRARRARASRCPSSSRPPGQGCLALEARADDDPPPRRPRPPDRPRKR